MTNCMMIHRAVWIPVRGTLFKWGHKIVGDNINGYIGSLVETSDVFWELEENLMRELRGER